MSEAKGLPINEKEFLSLVEKLMSFSEKLQNAPHLKLIPQEGLVADAVLEVLAPYSSAKGGPLVVKKLTYVEGRSNLVVHYPGTSDKSLSFVGSHMDVVPARAEDWKPTIPPFKLTRDTENPDKLYGRGVTDCLGHVAMLACLIKEIAIRKPKLEVGVALVFIACEEDSSITGVGIDEMAKHGELEFLKKSPLFWVDSANFGPTLGTGGIVTWELKAVGRAFHSGFPHKAINPINLASEAVKFMQKRFHVDFPKKKEDDEYKFEAASSMKPTQIQCPPGGLNQIPPTCTISGDIRVTPFNPMSEICSKVEGYIKELNSDITKLESFGYDKYELKAENQKGTLEFKWLSKPSAGIAVNTKSPGYAALSTAMKEINKFSPFALTGSLPLVGDLQVAGFDVQIVGFGRMEAYHAANEFGFLSEFLQGAVVCSRIVEILNGGSVLAASK